MTVLKHPRCSLPRAQLGLVLAGALVLATPVSAQPEDEVEESPSSEQVELERGRLEYQSGRYAECARILGDALDRDSEQRFRDPELIREARLYRAACLIGSGQDEEADGELSQAIKEGPTLDAPDQRVFPPEVVRRYIQLRVSMLDELRAQELKRKQSELKIKQARDAKAKREAQRVKDLEQYAQVQSYTRVNSRWLAAVPFGVGQFQNREYGLGYTFLIAEGLLLGATLTAAVLELSLHREAVATGARGETLDNVGLNADLRTLTGVATVAGWSFIAVTLAGIVQAQLAFVPEHTDVRYKPLPPQLRSGGSARNYLAPGAVAVVPGLLPLPHGGGIGLSGRF